jgi:hypothetical protein
MPVCSITALGISILANSFFAVVQVKKARKSEKVTSKITQVPFPKKLATFWVSQRPGQVRKATESWKKREKSR